MPENLSGIGPGRTQELKFDRKGPCKVVQGEQLVAHKLVEDKIIARRRRPQHAQDKKSRTVEVGIIVNQDRCGLLEIASGKKGRQRILNQPFSKLTRGSDIAGMRPWVEKNPRSFTVPAWAQSSGNPSKLSKPTKRACEWRKSSVIRDIDRPPYTPNSKYSSGTSPIVFAAKS
ncbi:MAG: hypothetical protein JO162_01460 [Alphaproteobacteria bacterium]|nr:hypothetical protein [Alphaproteobacteria bacterium]